jgi:hypothetical protein
MRLVQTDAEAKARFYAALGQGSFDPAPRPSNPFSTPTHDDLTGTEIIFV